MIRLSFWMAFFIGQMSIERDAIFANFRQKNDTMIPENIKQLLHFVCLGILGFVTIGATVRLFAGGNIFEGLFTLLVCANMWYVAIKKKSESN